MKVHNLTDVSTPALVGAGLVNVSIMVGDVSVKPGESAEVARVPASAARYVRVDALFVGQNPPPRYLAAKAKQQKPEQKPVERKQLAVEDKVEVKDDMSTAKTEPPMRSRRTRSDE